MGPCQHLPHTQFPVHGCGCMPMHGCTVVSVFIHSQAAAVAVYSRNQNKPHFTLSQMRLSSSHLFPHVDVMDSVLRNWQGGRYTIFINIQKECLCLPWLYSVSFDRESQLNIKTYPFAFACDRNTWVTCYSSRVLNSIATLDYSCHQVRNSVSPTARDSYRGGQLN